ncbi:MAG: helix-turn-helix transcriptional regulator [Christensenellales bacterium]|nr:helix-turn-helix transcriptional regulator [Christensenellales bacterium]
MSIGQNIKRIREAHGLSQAELTQIAGVTDKAVSTWENDIKTPRMGAIQRMADYFHILKSDIIEDKDSFPPSTTESELLQLYRSVNAGGQAYILSAARMVAGNPAMRKDVSDN